MTDTQIQDQSHQPLTLRDYWKHTPTKDQYQNETYIQRTSYKIAKFFSYFGICSARWEQLVRQNKYENTNN